MTTKTLAQHLQPLLVDSPRRRRRAAVVPGLALAAVAARESLENNILPYLDTLRDAIPELWPERRLYDEAWILGLTADLPSGTCRGRPYKAYSRLEFALRVDIHAGLFSISAHSTTFDQDHETQDYSGTLGEASAEDLETFVEHECLVFATRFYENAPGSLKRRKIEDA